MQIALFLILPTLAFGLDFHTSCKSNSSVAVICSGPTIIEIPQMPVNTSLLQLNDTSITIIHKDSLKDKEYLFRFSLDYSHLHTIHPQAFYAAPQLRSVKLSCNALAHLPERVFSPLADLEQLHLNGNQLEAISPEMFKGLVGLKDIDLSWNKICFLTQDVFKGLTKLIYLNLARNSLKALPPTVFHSLTNLRILMLNNNELELLEAGLFDQLVNLDNLKIHQNKIVRLPPEIFWSLGKLEYLSLSSNQLQGIPAKTFYHMPMIAKLTIYKNPLLTLPNEMMGYMPYISKFYLYNTNLTTVPGNLFANMTSMLNLNLHHNHKLRELPADLFCCLPKLNMLSLRMNDLYNLHPELFSKLNRLSVLFLHGNKLQTLPTKIFHNLLHVVSIHLQDNNLQTLSGDIFSSNTALMYVNLTGNPWDCSCTIRELAQWIRDNEDKVLDRADVMCHIPRHQMLHTLRSLRDDDFNICDPTTADPKTLFGGFATTKSAYSVLPTTPLKTLTSAPPTLEAMTLSSSGQSTISDTTSVAMSPAFSTEEMWSIPTQDSSTLFVDKFVVEKGPVFVHHNHHQDWVYVWSLPSDAALTGFFMACHIILVAVGILLIVAAMYSVFHLDKAMKEQDKYTLSGV